MRRAFLRYGTTAPRRFFEPLGCSIFARHFCYDIEIIYRLPHITPFNHAPASATARRAAPTTSVNRMNPCSIPG